MPRVTIGMPVYNGENFVGHAIRSVLAQTYDDWELVISDNASTDSTQQICEAYAADDMRIQYHRADENLGAAWNFNRVFKLGNSEFFRWLSHDDCLAPTILEKCVNLLDAQPEIVNCSTSTGAIDSDGYRILDGDSHGSDFLCQGLSENSEQNRLRLQQASSPSQRYRGVLLYSRRCYEIYGLMRRATMDRTQLHPVYSGGEKVLLAELALRGPFHELREPLFFVRWHDDRFTSKTSTRQQDSHTSPKRSDRFSLPHQYRSTLGYLQLIKDVKIPLSQRVACMFVWIRFTLQISKWSTILLNTLSGTSTSAQIEGPTRRGERVHERSFVPPTNDGLEPIQQTVAEDRCLS